MELNDEQYARALEVLLTEPVGDPDSECGATRGPGHPACWLSVDHMDTDTVHARYGVTWS